MARAKKIPMREDRFGTAIGYGVELTADFKIQAQVDKAAIAWVNSQRVYLEPEEDTLVPVQIMGQTHYWIHPEKTVLTDTPALHLSDATGCPLKVVKNLNEMQALLEEGQAYIPEITPQNAVTFGSGYFRQMGLLPTNPEKALWNKEYEFVYSPDGITEERPHQIKEIRNATMTVGHRKDGWTIEQHLMEARPYWFNYELQMQHLFKVDYSYLTVWYLNDHDAMTFRIDSTQEERDKVGAAMAAQFKSISMHRALGTFPPSSERTGPSDCFKFDEYCPWIHEEPCLTQVPILDMQHELANPS